MATKDEWSNNKSNTSVQGLPRGGSYRSTQGLVAAGSSGCYWSSTPDGGKAYDFYTASGNTNVYSYDHPEYGFSVRPVLAQ